MESAKTNEQELTSTMGSLLSTSKEEKNDASSDSTPTSSTDAFTTTSTSQIAADDPISSTSSDVLDSKKADKVNDNLNTGSLKTTANPSSIMTSSIVSEKDLLVMNITDTSTEKITENVDDIVQDLENLLGEPTTTFDFTIRSKDSKQSSATIQSKEISMDLDEFAAEFQFDEKPKDVVIESKSTISTNQDDYENNRQNESVEKLKENLPSTVEDSNKQSETPSTLENTDQESADNNTDSPSESTQKEKSEDNEEQIERSQDEQDPIEKPENDCKEIEKSEDDCEQIENVKDNQEEQPVEELTANLDVSSTNLKESETSERKTEESESDKIIQDEPIVETNTSEEESPLCTFNESAKIINNETASKEDSSEIYSENVSNENVNTQSEMEEPDLSIHQNEKTDQEDSAEVQMEVQNDDSEEVKENVSKIGEVISSDNTAKSENITEIQNDDCEVVVEENVSKIEDVIPENTSKSEDITDFQNDDSEMVKEDVSKIEVIPPENTSESEDVTEIQNDDSETVKENVPSENTSKSEDITDFQNDDSEIVKEDVPKIEVIPSENTSESENVTEIQNDDSEVVEENVPKIEEVTPSEDTSKSEDITEPLAMEEHEAKTDISEDVPVESDHQSLENTIPETLSVPNADENFESSAVEEAEMKVEETEQVQDEVNVTEKSKDNEENSTDTTQEVEETDQDQVQSVINDVCEENREVVVRKESEETVLVTEIETQAEVTEIETQSETSERVDEKTLIETVQESGSDSTPKEQTLNRVETEGQHKVEDNLPFVESQPEEVISVVENTQATDALETNTEATEKITESFNEETAFKEAELENSESKICQVEDSANYQTEAGDIIEQNIVPDENQTTSSLNVFESLETVPPEAPTVLDNQTIFDNPESSNAEQVITDIVSSSDAVTENAVTSLINTCVEMEDPSSSKVKTLEESVIENNMLPLVMEDVPDLDMLNAISTLSDHKPDLMSDNLENNDTLLGSNTLVNEEQRNVPFEACMDTALPTVDEIFAEPNDQQSVELPDDNLETLLAVASLQGVCETESSYNMTPVEDIASFTPDIKIQDEKIESLFEQKESPPEVVEETETALDTLLNSESEYVKQKDNLKEPLVISVDDGEKEKVYSPKIIIKPIKSPVEEVTSATTSESDEKESNKGSLKMTITKQSDTMHSILKIYDPAADETYHGEEPTVPKLIIKPIVQPTEHQPQPHSPKISTRSSKQVFSPSTSGGSQRSASPRITIKPIVKPPENESVVAPVKITIKPVLKPEQKHSPKLTIKPIVKPEEENCIEPKVHSPRVTIKPVVKPSSDDCEQAPSPRITIKPIIKPDVESTPRVTIKPVVKPPQEKSTEMSELSVEKSSPKITIKPIVKPQEVEVQSEDFEDSIKERIVLKINKGTIPSSSKKRDSGQEEEKTPKIKLKFPKEGGHPHIVQESPHSKRALEMSDHDKVKRQRIESFLPGVTITPIAPHSKLKEMLSKNLISEKMNIVEDDDDDDVTIVEDPLPDKASPIVISEESNQDSSIPVDVRDPISEIPVFEITPDSVKTINLQPTPVTESPPVLPAPRKRGRPRKVPLQVREDFKDPKEEEPPKPIVIESTRPKRSCRGQSVRTTLGIKPRKPRGPGRGRGGKRGMGTRSTPTPEPPPTKAKEPKLSAAKLKPFKEDLLLLSDKTEVEIDDGFNKSPSQPILAPPTPQTDNSTTDRADIVMYEEETRMSAETSSRAQTPAKQVISSIPTVDLVEESQSSVHSVQSTATTESVKVRKGPRLEVHQEPEGAVISADQLAEYYWMGGGPYMLQEQVAQFLGIKSFKRKYPNIARRVVDMQERDFIRESGLAGEAMCDLGLTAVSSSDILDIMYSDFQDKYEEYCKHQRDRQAKDLTNKQKALSLAASQEKTKIDITQQAVQSAASWNANFNKARRDQRKACMDLQTLTVHFPKGKMKQINKPKIGNYPVALVPGQFTDYYKEFTPTEINNLPLNTMCYDSIKRGAHEMECDSQTDGSGSESESSTSDSDSSYSGSSDAEDCTICHKAPPKRIAAVQ